VPKELKQRIDCLPCKAKKLLKQRLDFTFEGRIETTEWLPIIQSQKSVETMVRFSIWKKELKQQIDWVQSKVKNCCLQSKAKRFVETKIRFSIWQKNWNDRSIAYTATTLFGFPFKKRIETTDRLPLMEGQKIAETTVRFVIWHKKWKDG